MKQCLKQAYWWMVFQVMQIQLMILMKIGEFISKLIE